MSEAKKTKNYDELWKELCDLPDTVIGEILDGELIVSPRPTPRHVNASSMLGGILIGHFRSNNHGSGGWWILDEPQIHFVEKVIVPDIAGWKKDRLPKLPEKAYFELAPDWVCEILSLSTVKYDRISKLRAYAENGVPYYWIVDPLNKTLEIFVLDGTSYKLEAGFEGNDRVSAPPFGAIEFNLADIWGDSQE